MVGFGLRKARIFEISSSPPFSLIPANVSFVLFDVKLFIVMLYVENKARFRWLLRGAFDGLLRL